MGIQPAASGPHPEGHPARCGHASDAALAPRDRVAWQAADIDQAIHDALASKQIKSLTAGKIGMGTREVGDLIAKLVS